MQVCKAGAALAAQARRQQLPRIVSMQPGSNAGCIACTERSAACTQHQPSTECLKRHDPTPLQKCTSSASAEHILMVRRILPQPSSQNKARRASLDFSSGREGLLGENKGAFDINV